MSGSFNNVNNGGVGGAGNLEGIGGITPTNPNDEHADAKALVAGSTQTAATSLSTQPPSLNSTNQSSVSSDASTSSATSGTMPVNQSIPSYVGGGIDESPSFSTVSSVSTDPNSEVGTSSIASSRSSVSSVKSETRDVLNKDNSIDLCGITPRHMEAIQEVCQEEGVFLMLRPSEAATGRLIDLGFATKSMDVHDKSSNWGLGAGFVPCDPAFSKKLGGEPNLKIVDKMQAEEGKHGEAHAKQLNLSDDAFNDLLAANHFDFTDKDTGKTYETKEVQVKGGDPNLTYYQSERKPDVVFARNEQGDVFWQAVNADEAGALQLEGNKTEFMVWAYDVTDANTGKTELKEVTGDYDMWMVCPHQVAAGAEEYISHEDGHGRSATTEFTQGFIDKLNARCAEKTGDERPVFNHGPEAANKSFTQNMDPKVALFCPGEAQPSVVEYTDLAHVLSDIREGGYLAAVNPEWAEGVTLGIEDMADAPTDFDDDKTVQHGRKAKENLEGKAGRTITNFFIDNLLPNAKSEILRRSIQGGDESPSVINAKSQEIDDLSSDDSSLESKKLPVRDENGKALDMSDRHQELKPARVVGRPLMQEQKELGKALGKGLPADAFPDWHRHDAALESSANKRSSNIEQSLVRTEFSTKNGGAIAVDASDKSKLATSAQLDESLEAYLRKGADDDPNLL